MPHRVYMCGDFMKIHSTLEKTTFSRGIYSHRAVLLGPRSSYSTTCREHEWLINVYNLGNPAHPNPGNQFFHPISLPRILGILTCVGETGCGGRVAGSG